MIELKATLVLLLFATVSSRTIKERRDSQEEAWWTHTNVYQIYPRSFQDSDGDGVGDLKGIESRLGYLVDLGVEALWMSPIYKSPMKDFGYDISDFRDIDPLFGTLEDFKALVESAHNKGLKVIMDFVPNHSSDEHEWFIRSVQRKDPYTDYYMWQDPKGFDDDGNPIPPNNWVSVFRYSAWEFNEERGQFYLHQFVPGQPDLNYRNPTVVEEMKDVLRFWLELGVDGFRMDAVAHIIEDDMLRDDPLIPGCDDVDDYGCYNHIYTNGLPDTREILAILNSVMDEFVAVDGFDRVVMLEVYTNITEEMKYYECSDFPFNFALMADYPVSASEIEFRINEFVDNLPEGKVANWVTGNHDNNRIGSRVGPSLMDAMNMLVLTLPGVAITYQGEEIGMTDTDISYEDTVDPAGCNCGPDRYQECSRDPERTPMQWSDEANAGFSSAEQTWLPINENYKTINVETEKSDPTSHLAVFKSILQVRNSEPTFKDGLVRTKSVDQVLAISRSVDNLIYKVFVTIVNFGEEEATVDLFAEFHPTLETGLVLVTSMNGNEANQAGSVVNVRELRLQPSEAVLVWLTQL